MEKIVRKYSQLSWHEALFLGPFWFFKVHILAWNRKQLEEGISCIIYWPEGPFLSYWQVFLTNHLWNKKKFPWEIPHLVIDDKGPYTWKDCSNFLLKRAARPPKKKIHIRRHQNYLTGYSNSQLFMLFLRTNSSAYAVSWNYMSHTLEIFSHFNDNS